MTVPTPRLGRLARFALIGCAALMPAVAQAQSDTSPKANYFDDPFLQVSQGIADCPRPEGPEITEAERLAQTHYRVERGNSCYAAGRCRLPNAYLYDREIIPRVKKAVDADGRFADTSVWALGQRRWVWLRGCVRDAGQSRALEQLVRQIDDVEAVINELQIQAR